jgi:hypothetical protein
MYIYFTFQILDNTGKSYENSEDVAPICSLQSFWKDIFFKIRGFQMSGGTFLFPYTNYVTTLLGASDRAASGWLKDLEMWVVDTPSKFDIAGADNAGFTTRKTLTLNSKLVNVKLRVPLDLFNQDGRLLPTNTECELSFTHAPDTFRLMQSDGTGGGSQALTANSVVLFSKMQLEVTRITPRSDILQAIETRLLAVPMEFPYRRFLTQSFQLLANSTEANITLYMRERPESVIVFFVPTTNFTGTATNNPFRLYNPNVQDCILYVNGEAFPNRKGYLNVPADVYQIDPYFNLLEFQGVLHNDSKGQVDLTLFQAGAFFFVFDLTYNPVGSLTRENPVLSNTVLKISMAGTGSTENLQILTIGTFPAKMVIDSSRTASSTAVPGTF